MRMLASLGRRRFTVGGLVLGGWGAVCDLVGARAAAAAGKTMQKQGPGGQIQQPQGTQQKAIGATPFRAKAKAFDVTGGSKPGDTVTLKLTIETTGGGTKSVPWTIYRDGDVVLKSDTKSGVAGGTTFDVNTTWAATAGSHDFYGEVDPSNTLNEPSSERGNNLSARTTRVFSDWPGWLEAAKAGTKTAISLWAQGAMLSGVRVNGPTASDGRVTGPDIGGPIVSALKDAGMPNDAAQHFGHAVAGAWRDWTDTIRVPGLPWYPAFAAVPAAQAPPAPNVPTPFASLASDPTKLAPGTLAGRIKHDIGTAKDWPGAGGIDGYASWFSGHLATWLPQCQVMLVMGKGPVPSFAPPYVPVGPVVGGEASGHGFQGCPAWVL
jgi:hypothetical protein